MGECTEYLSENGLQLLRSSEEGPDRLRVLMSNGIAIAPDFLSKQGVQALLAEHQALRDLAYHSNCQIPPFRSDDGNQAAPGGAFPVGRQSLRVVAADQLAGDSPLLRIARCKKFHNLIAAFTGRPRIYPYADQLGEANYVEMLHGDEVPWHVDTSDCASSLILQLPHEGGQLDLTPVSSAALDALRRGDELRSASIRQAPVGTLVVFMGASSLHRVTRVVGARSRINAILGHALRSSSRSSAEVRSFRYGRTN